MIIAILGSAGFIGINLAQTLVAAGHSVRCFDRAHACLPSNKDVFQYGTISFYDGDFFSPADLANVLEGCDVCCHLVSTSVPVTSNADPALDVQNNLVGTLRFLDAARKANVGKIIFPSSGGAIYGVTHAPRVDEMHPTSPASSYGIVKLAVEKYLALYQDLYGLKYMCLRIANSYGPFQRLESAQGVVGVFLGHILRGQPLTVWGDGSTVRDYIFIDDVCQAFLAAIESDLSTHTFNIGSGKGHSVNDLISCMRQVTGRKIQAEYRAAQSPTIPYSVLDISSAQIKLQWSPTVSIRQGIERTWQWILNAYT